ncbi:MAG: PIG-L family deacetylase [Armatimonadetes bacterium]|nr:PIG-L family deacetylase [Armatimonadota bacterium]
MEKLRVLAVGAHPDDVEILCGGTLAKYAARGCEVFIGIATDGAAGHAVIKPEELREIRMKEATAAAEVIGAQIRFLDEPDEWLFHDRRTREKFIELIRWADPQVIITHNPDDYHPDHRACSDLVFAASFLSTLPHIMPEITAQKSVAALYYMDSLAGVGFVPEFYVDITDTYAKKIEMLSKHESQVAWLRDHDNIDILQFVQTVARRRGVECGVQYAEGFKAAWVWPRVHPRHLLP